MVPAGWCAAGGDELPHTLQERLVARLQVAVPAASLERGELTFALF